MKIIYLVTALLLTISQLSFAQPIRAIGYNIEGGYKPDASIGTIVNNMNKLGHSDLWAFSEATIDWVPTLTKSAGKNYQSFATSNAISTTDSLVIIVNTDRFDVIDHKELFDVQVKRYSRPTLVTILKDKVTGKNFFFMVNHLDRGDAIARHKQALILNQYIKSIDMPLVAMGDYNFDWDLNSTTPSYDLG